MNRILQYFAVVFLLVGVTYSCTNEKERTYKPAKITPLENSWDKAVPHQEIPEGLASLSAQHCGACHQEHYEEWQHSTHSHAWTDMQFQAELKKETSPFMCINCHIPLQNQQEEIVSGLYNGDIYKPVKKKNPHFDQTLQQEGITCAACHVRDGAVIGPTGTDKAPHKTIKGEMHLSEQLCVSCHNASAVITPTLACSFETGDEWQAGPYAKEKNCIDCHMEEIERSIVPGYEKRLSHRHYFAGSGIPKVEGAKTKALEGLHITPIEIAKGYSAKDSLIFALTVKNEHAGHRLPTGDPERFYTIDFVLTSTKGDTVSIKQDRIGEHWEWYPEAKKISDNNLNPKEERTFTFVVKDLKRGQYNLSTTITKHRLNKASAEYNKLPDTYPLYKVIYQQNEKIHISK